MMHCHLSLAPPWQDWNGRALGRSGAAGFQLFGVERRKKNRFAGRIQAVVKRSPKRLKYDTPGPGAGKSKEIFHLEIDQFGSNLWKLDQVVSLLQDGGVGVVPTDTIYAIVCDLHNRAAIERLYRIKDMDAKKPLSILCRSFQDIDKYTTGFPTSFFRVARQCLPGPYTFILPASKDMPKQCTRFGGSVAASYAPRKSVGVRIPDDSVWREMAGQLEHPLLCTSVRRPADDEWMLDPAIIADTYGVSSGRESVDFIVDGGTRVANPSTVVDMTGTMPVVLRRGKGVLEDWMVGDTDSEIVNPYS
ncbi:hypothetical protein SELMODRAFT_441705 [Selaginella moellendorffii]|uniref:Threonylcarbamoyl-AMP synthase n=1 Tax=Selaginella moellendorffii TaxID=88036 RepID=D8RL40_SELML|nr:uncharacterized protein LOC9650198 [Selaginella moellendorffii]EFJ26848.1 hypothetical protein SELMODRAFT_441705 [Selaginella moellendorffii]|eukprot:XP_002971931.1 uncharacterized protein LOC9650198 [Selaginella moellendorffii]